MYMSSMDVASRTVSLAYQIFVEIFITVDSLKLSDFSVFSYRCALYRQPKL